MSSAGDVDGDGRDDLIIGRLTPMAGGEFWRGYLITAADLAAADAADGTADGVIDLDNVAAQATSYQFIGTEAVIMLDTLCPLRGMWMAMAGMI